MTDRITIKHLRWAVDALNIACGFPTKAWETTPAGNKAHVGCYVLDCAYGGYRLCRIVNESGGERDITPLRGARETYELIRAYRAGLGV